MRTAEKPATEPLRGDPSVLEHPVTNGRSARTQPRVRQTMRSPQRSAPKPPPPAPRRRTEPERTAPPLRERVLRSIGVRAGWLVVVIAGAAGVLATRTFDGVPDLVREVGAALVSVGLAWGLGVRTGGRPFWAAGLSAALAVGAIVSGWEPLLAGASVGTGVLAATLAVMSTVPAATFGIALREVLVATAIAWVGAFGVVGYGSGSQPQVDPNRFGYVVLGLSLAGAFALVYRLGAGLHGLGRRGYAVAVGGVLMLALALAYSEALAHWGSREMVGSLDDLRASIRSTFGAVAHPIVSLLGYPALVWGVFMRARRRQGWWVCAFGVAATAPIATRLVGGDLEPGAIALGGLYSFAVGVVIGYLVIRVEQFLTGSHGRRARRDEEAVAHRPEPGRTRPLH
ncbi:hypothetical protein [Marmoricola sp. RAF53]|uniref:hypothetical protein n=1 Tax=Marmoricola sp. RAF53 TaxID=3233059 RepID=UPI003F98B84F